MNPIELIEQLVKLQLASYEAQIEAILYLEKYQHKQKLVYQLKLMIECLLKLIEHTEVELLKTVEKETEKQLGESAEITNLLSEAKKSDPMNPLVFEIEQEAKEEHAELTSSLAKAENLATIEITQSFGVMKKDIRELLKKVTYL